MDHAEVLDRIAQVALAYDDIDPSTVPVSDADFTEVQAEVYVDAVLAAAFTLRDPIPGAYPHGWYEQTVDDDELRELIREHQR